MARRPRSEPPRRGRQPGSPSWQPGPTPAWDAPLHASRIPPLVQRSAPGADPGDTPRYSGIRRPPSAGLSVRSEPRSTREIARAAGTRVLGRATVNTVKPLVLFAAGESDSDFLYATRMSVGEALYVRFAERGGLREASSQPGRPPQRRRRPPLARRPSPDLGAADGQGAGRAPGDRLRGRGDDHRRGARVGASALPRRGPDPGPRPGDHRHLSA